LYNSSCTAVKTARNGSITSVGTNNTITTNLSQASNYFTLGYITFLTGNNAGLSYNIKANTSIGVLQTSSPLNFPATVGDTFNAYAGCDKQLSTCSTKFSNQSNFRGTPFVPAPYTAY
jgi:uncharacterized phage protein (TIGR02218 family)